MGPMRMAVEHALRGLAVSVFHDIGDVRHRGLLMRRSISSGGPASINHMRWANFEASVLEEVHLSTPGEILNSVCVLYTPCNSLKTNS